MSQGISPLSFHENKIWVLDQRVLPNTVHYDALLTLKDGFDAIKLMKVRGAPLIGFTAIFAMSVWCENSKNQNYNEAISYLNSARPTAVNLSFELQIVKDLIEKNLAQKKSLKEISKIIYDHGMNMLQSSEERHLAMAKFGLQEMTDLYGSRKLNILTHCNTGRLACGSLGTALGVISHLGKMNRIKNVYVDETRPYLQGSRLTAFELYQENLPHQIVVEGAASYLMKNKLVDAIFVGADRIAANGDTANKIGTSNLSILAKYYNIPFYIVAPISTFDLATPDGSLIEIEFRPEKEIKSYGNSTIAPIKSSALNPSFDITEVKNITGIICEKGIIRPTKPANISETIL